MNSATDNPLVFIDTGDVVSGGNFHGEYPAKVYSYLGCFFRFCNVRFCVRLWIIWQLVYMKSVV
jgi:hypothetical protein